MVIDRESGGVETYNDFMAYGNGFNPAFVFGEAIYFIGQPKNDRPIRNMLTNSRFMRLDLDSGEFTTIFNARRNPPETPLDQELENRKFEVCLSDDQSRFLFRHRGYYSYDISKNIFTELNRDEYESQSDLGNARKDERDYFFQGKHHTWHFLSRVTGPPSALTADGFNLIFYQDRSRANGFRMARIEPSNLPADPMLRQDVNNSIFERSIKMVGVGGSTALFKVTSGDARGLLIIENDDLDAALSQSPALTTP